MKLQKQNFTLDFLQCLVDMYGHCIPLSYRKIANDIGTISHTTVQHHVLKLEKTGVITIDNKGRKNQVIHISIEKYNDMKTND